MHVTLRNPNICRAPLSRWSRTSLFFDLKIFVGGGVRMSRNQSETGLSDTRAETIQKRELPDPRIYGPLVQQLLHAVRLSASRAANSAPLVQLTAARID